MWHQLPVAQSYVNLTSHQVKFRLQKFNMKEETIKSGFQDLMWQEKYSLIKILLKKINHWKTGLSKFKAKARCRSSDAIELNWIVQSRLLGCGGFQLVRKLFLMRFKFRVAVQLHLLVCAVLQLARNNLFIGHIYSQLNCPVVSRDAEWFWIITLGGAF